MDRSAGVVYDRTEDVMIFNLYKILQNGKREVVDQLILCVEIGAFTSKLTAVEGDNSNVIYFHEGSQEVSYEFLFYTDIGKGNYEIEFESFEYSDLEISGNPYSISANSRRRGMSMSLSITHS